MPITPSTLISPPCTTANTLATTESADDLAVMIDQASAAFRGQSNRLTPFYEPVQRLEHNGRIFYGLHKDRQGEIDNSPGGWRVLTQALLYDMGLPADTSLVQVVGDSACYDQAGTAHNRQVLREELPENSLLLWGFTGRIRNDGLNCDVNGLVNEMIEGDPNRWANRALANIVSYHTPIALRTWGCDGSRSAKHFWLVYGEDIEQTRSTLASFGQDVHSSDHLSRRLISLEGGVQSLNQMVRCLELGQPITVTAHTRGPYHEPSWVHSLAGKPLYRDGDGLVYHVDKHPETTSHKGEIVYVDGFSDRVVGRMPTDDVRPYLAEEHRWYGDFFSVGTLCLFMQERIKARTQIGGEVSREMLAEWWHEYASTHLPANPKARDFHTKQALLVDVEERFVRVGHKLADGVTVRANAFADRLVEV